MRHEATVLIIDDEPIVRQAFADCLTDAGYRVLEAADGADGLDKLRASPPDLILCDLRMPGLDGLDVLARAREQDPDLPVIVVSGAGSMADAVEALKRGAWDYVTKPVLDISLLIAAVTRALERAALVRDNREYQCHLELINRDLSRALAQLRTDQEAGRRLQFQLLPRDGREFGPYRMSRRMFPSTYLSGDFIDYFTIDNRRVGFYVVDVSGHGAASAFVTVMLRTLIRQYQEAYVRRRDDTALRPDEMLGVIDRHLQHQEVDKHVTMFYGVIDRIEHTLTFGSGGQYPYPILRTGGDTRWLDQRGRAVGLFPDARFTTEQVDLPPGCHLLVVSDGVLELEGLRGDSASEKLNTLRTHAANRALSLDALAGVIGLDAPVELVDDVGMLLVERREA